ncbi:MAG: hypothetical protein AAFV25_02250 [Bacteroidota bacterium]
MAPNVSNEEKKGSGNNKIVIAKVIGLGVGAVLFFWLLAICRDLLIIDMYGVKNARLNLRTLLLFASILIIPNVSANLLNTYRPSIKPVPIAIYSGLLVMVIEFIYLVIRNLYVLELPIRLLSPTFLGLPIGLGITGFLVAWFRINRVRNIESRVPGILILIFWVLFLIVRHMNTLPTLS